MFNGNSYRYFVNVEGFIRVADSTRVWDGGEDKEQEEEKGS